MSIEMPQMPRNLATSSAYQQTTILLITKDTSQQLLTGSLVRLFFEIVFDSSDKGQKNEYNQTL